MSATAFQRMRREAAARAEAEAKAKEQVKPNPATKKNTPKKEK